ncbi:MAG: GNAT family N-acetyltransferase [Anaerolineae bacterium]|nr:GNAT family N-acetyltransferase [Anaerolineae bacterium]
MNENIIIQRLQGDDQFDLAHFLRRYAFSPSPPIADPGEGWQKDWWKNARETAETFVLLKDGRPQATAAHVTMRHTIRDLIVPTWGLWGVATHPAARRNGYARQLLAAWHEAAYEAGLAVTLLYPFRESFYQRLGYVTYPQPRKVKFEVANLAPLLKWDFPGEIDLRSTQDDFQTWRDYLRTFQPHIHGFALSDSGWPESVMRFNSNREHWLALARIEGEVRGAMLYRLEGPEGAFDMKVNGFYSSDVWGRYLLLEWMARHIDHAREATVSLPPFEQPDTWLEDLKVKFEGGFAPMARVLNVAQIGGIQAGPGTFTARVHDDHCPWNNGIYRFETADGVLHVSALNAPDSADCDLAIQGVTALVYGAHDPATFTLRGWGDPPPAVQATMRRMFPARLPYMHEKF